MKLCTGASVAPKSLSNLALIRVVYATFPDGESSPNESVNINPW